MPASPRRRINTTKRLVRNQHYGKGKKGMLHASPPGNLYNKRWKDESGAREGKPREI